LDCTPARKAAKILLYVHSSGQSKPAASCDERQHCPLQSQHQKEVHTLNGSQTMFQTNGHPSYRHTVRGQECLYQSVQPQCQHDDISCRKYTQLSFHHALRKRIPCVNRYQHPFHRHRQSCLGRHIELILSTQRFSQGLVPCNALSFFACDFKPFQGSADYRLITAKMFADFRLVSAGVNLQI